MKTHFVLGCAAIMACTQPVMGQQWLTTGNNGLSWTTNFLGTTDGVPINFRTNNLFRARINPKISYAIGLAPNAPRDGFMLLSGRSSFPQNVKGPFTRLHLVDDVGVDNPITYAQEIGYRRWMRNGITFTGNSDQAYIGQKYAGNDNTDFVIQWSKKVRLRQPRSARLHIAAVDRGSHDFARC